jgi:hypothetical protein
MIAYCHQCEADTIHETIKKHEEHVVIEDVGQFWSEFEIIRCKGCGTVSFAENRWDEDDYNFHDQTHDNHYKFYPPRDDDKRPPDVAVAASSDIPDDIKRVYQEVIKAINEDLLLLAAVGLRLIVEAICRVERCKAYCRRKGYIDNLKTHINVLAEKGVITRAHAKVLHRHRFLGNNAAHQILAAPKNEVLAALEIAEIMLRTIYTLKTLGKKIASTDGNPAAEARFRRARKAAKKASKAKAVIPASKATASLTIQAQPTP